jgi:predicted RNA-binding Zn ribbon-like protein
MKNTVLKAPTNEDHLDFVGDDLAINFINTRRMVEGQVTDTLQSGRDVKDWLRRLEVPVAKGTLPFSDSVLLRRARELRETALTAVKDRKSQKIPSLVALNRFLKDAPSRVVLTTDDANNLRVTRVYGKETVEAFLAPVAEALATLLAAGEFDLVGIARATIVSCGSMTVRKATVEGGAHRQVAEIVQR